MPANQDAVAGVSSGPPVLRPGYGGTHAAVRFALGVWTAITLVATVLVWRRTSGAFAVPTNAWVPCLSATVAAMLCLAAHAALHLHSRPVMPRRKHIFAAAASLLLPATIGWVLWTSSSALVGGYLAMLELICTLALILIRDLYRTVERQAGAAETAGTMQPSEGPLVPRARADSEEPLSADEISERSAAARLEDPSILQWMTRRQLDDGGEVIEGSLRLDFPIGQKLAVAHVPFIPPLPTRPQARCHVLSDFDGRASVAAAFSYGIRIEARRNAADEPATLEITFTAQVPAVEVRAA
jgi:hypothetical protein